MKHLNSFILESISGANGKQGVKVIYLMPDTDVEVPSDFDADDALSALQDAVLNDLPGYSGESIRKIGTKNANHLVDAHIEYDDAEFNDEPRAQFFVEYELSYDVDEMTYCTFEGVRYVMVFDEFDNYDEDYIEALFMSFEDPNRDWAPLTYDGFEWA